MRWSYPGRLIGLTVPSINRKQLSRAPTFMWMAFEYSSSFTGCKIAGFHWKIRWLWLIQIKSRTSFVIMLRTGARLPKLPIMYEYRHGYASLQRSMHSPSILSMIERCRHLNTPEIWRASARAGRLCLWTLNLATHSESSISSKSNLLNSSYGKSRFLELFRS